METVYWHTAHLNKLSDNGAVIIEEFRYLLWRTWDATRPHLLWVLLNPSTADDQIDDPTLKRCRAFSKMWGYGALEIVNLFAFRATRPRDLQTIPDPIGTENNRYIIDAATRATSIIVAWGERGVYQQRDRAVLTLLHRHAPRQLWCLGTAHNGRPRHPLYIPYCTAPIPYVLEAP